MYEIAKKMLANLTDAERKVIWIIIDAHPDAIIADLEQVLDSVYQMDGK